MFSLCVLFPLFHVCTGGVNGRSVVCYGVRMASEGGGGGGGADLATFVVGLIILGALAQVAYSQFAKFGAVPAPLPQEANATTTDTTTN